MFLVLVPLCLAASILRADLNAAKADYALAQRYQNAKQFGMAVRSYLQALKEEPQWTAIYKSVGNSYYLAGDKKGALYYYKLYLRYYPQDAAAKSFADSLSGSSADEDNGAQGMQSNSQASADNRAGLDLRLELGGLYNSGSDMSQLFSGTNIALSGALGDYFGLGVDYVMKMGLILGLDLWDGPGRSYTTSLDTGFGTLSGTIGVSSTSFFLSPGWRFTLGPKIFLEPRLGLGFSSSTVTFSEGSGSSSGAASGFSAWPEVRGEYLFGHWGLGLNLGYLISSLSPVVSGGNNVEILNSDGTTSTWTLQNGGPTFGLDVAYHFF